MDTNLTTTTPTVELSPLCLEDLIPMVPAEDGYVCRSCGSTSGPVAR
jgi:hypothetical protein